MINIPQPPPPPAEEVEAAVQRCRDHPDFRTYPPASPDGIDEAQTALGITFPPHYRAFLEATNGLSVLRGRTNYFGVGSDAVVDIVEFNRPEGWLSTIPDDWLTPIPAVWIAIGASGRLVGLDARHDSDTEVISASLGLRQRASEWRFIGGRFTRGLHMACDEGMAGLDDPTWRRVVEQVDHVALEEGLVWGMMHYLEGVDDASSVRKVQLATALRLCVDLAADRDRLPDDVEVFGMLPYVDVDGLARARWVTSEEFPNGPPSHITVDGQVP